MLEEFQLERWPESLIECFYQVRFGHKPLSPEQAADVERRLNELENCLVVER